MKSRRAISFTLIVALIVIAASACSKNDNSTSAPKASTPTEALRAFYDAWKKRDADAMVNMFSKGQRQKLEESAKNDNETAAQRLSKGLHDPPPTFETQNEQVQGDHAAVELKIGDRWNKIQLVKENGEWKIDSK